MRTEAGDARPLGTDPTGGRARRRPPKASTMRASATALAGAALFAVMLPAPRPVVAQTAEEAVSAVLDDLHRLADEGDFEAYFDLYTPDAIFMGTDATERWTIEDFQGYARPAFADGNGWTYTPTERHVYVGPGGRTAWFDERLQNANFGETRGTGVLVLGEDGRWRITQYNLAIPIPNDLAREVVARIRETTGGG